MTGETQRRVCATCGRELGRYNKSGYCKRHVSAATARSPEWREKQRHGAQMAIWSDPIRLDRLRKQAREIFHLPQAVEARRRHCIENKLWLRGNAAQGKGSDARIKAGARGSSTKLAWCPAHLRQAYRELAASRACTAEEAKALILEQHETEMRRFRRKIEAEAA